MPAATETTDSPRTMIVNRPKRSAMCELTSGRPATRVSSIVTSGVATSTATATAHSA
jgi:hypothetical protein